MGSVCSIEPTDQGPDREFHEAIFAVDALVLATCEIVWLPPLQHELQAIATACTHVSDLPRSSQITVLEAPQIRQQVNTVRKRGVVWWIVLEPCIHACIFISIFLARDLRKCYLFL